MNAHAGHPLRVLQIMRKPLTGHQSFERLFQAINEQMPKEIDITTRYLPFHSQGVTRRILNALSVLIARADVVHITGDVHYILPCLWGRRTLLTIHDLGCLQCDHAWKRRLFKWTLFRIPLACATRVNTISDTVRQEVSSMFPKHAGHIIVIPNCLPSGFAHLPGSWPNRPRILMIGTKPNKNLHRMLTALKGLAVDLCIVGRMTPERRRELEAVGQPYRELGVVDDTELLHCYQETDMLAFVSTIEGFGMPVLEAQAMGRPVLCGDIPVLREVAGEAACFVDPHNTAAIRNGVERLIRDSAYRERLVEKGLENVKNYLPSESAMKYADLYREIVQNQAG